LLVALTILALLSAAFAWNRPTYANMLVAALVNALAAYGHVTTL